MKVKNVSLTLVGNEQDIIETFVRTNMNYLDEMYIIFWNSIDNSKAIINRLINEELNIHVLNGVGEVFSTFQQEKIVTWGVRKIQKIFNTNFNLFVLDSDEFIVIESKFTENFINRENQVYRVPRREIIFDGYNYEHCNPLLREYIARKKLQSQKSIIFNLNPNFNVNFGIGQHYIRYNNERMSTEIEYTGIDKGIRIDHFPVRSPEQFISKNLIGWSEYLKAYSHIAEQKNPVGVHWKKAYNWIIENDYKITSSMLEEYLYHTHFRDENGILNNDSIYITNSVPFKNVKIKYGYLAKSFVSTLASAITLIEANKKKTNRSFSIMDSPQENLELVGNSKIFALDTIPIIRRDGNTVYISGAVKGVTTINSVVAKVPIELAPNRNTQFVSVSSKNGVSGWQLDPHGNLKIIFNSLPLKYNTWLPFNFTYII
ncbi:glycosyltransferase family 2 protein [Weissella bombi]|uniref:Glycosyl transferase family 2 n=1 Tax=Weissella bombi TaxID=1505725 RepID=A0A1C3ZA09_9LACO|nr:glycosyltransferase family 2 protein [Weissella bombi]SCB79146.1 Glycosyl transferase family 2 [Weissella bombi]